MALDVIKMFTKYNHDVIKNKRNDWIVIHWVGSKSSAIDNGKYFANGERGASAHYFVDDDNVVQSVREGHVAYAVGSNGYLDQGSPYANEGHKYYGKCTNRNSISIEMCCSKDKNGKLYITDKTIERTGILVRGIQKRNNIDDDHVIRHFDVNGKICPGPYIEKLSWEKLHSKLVGKYFKIKAKGNLIARKTSSTLSAKTRTLEKGKVYGIIATNKKGTRGKTVKGDWITITDKYVEKL